MTPEQMQLIVDAEKGDKKSLEALSIQARERICAYLYRMTMDYNLAEDLTQETILEMVNSLNNLRDHNRFWSWLYQVARSKLLGHYRHEAKQQRHKTDTFYKQYIKRLNHEDSRTGLRELLNTELAHAVVNAMGRLKPDEREIISLRCFDQLAYTEIADIIQCSESHARIQFHRAKQSLKRKLIREGIGKGSLLAALSFFGKLTVADAAAAQNVTVPAAALHSSLGTILTAAVGMKMAAGIAGLLLLTASAGTVYVATLPEPTTPPRKQVTSLHYTMQSRNNVAGTPSSLSKGAYEQWWYFPEDVDGPVWMRMQRWDPSGKDKLCAWLQNGRANYYFHSGDQTVYLCNHRIWKTTYTDILVRRLPSDPPRLHAFLDQIERPQRGLIQQRDRRTGLITEIQDTRFANVKQFQSACEYNSLDASTFQPFWPDDSPVIDVRDEMRQRGWTCFEITGELNGKPVQGYGCIPFFTDYMTDHPAWLTLDVGNRIRIADTPSGAWLNDRAYPPGSFFAGLLRPWMGLHTIDGIRRDAAKQEIPFITDQKGDYYSDAMVQMHYKHQGIETQLEYLIDMDGDLIIHILLNTTDENGNVYEGLLKFNYFQSLPDDERPLFQPPDPPANLSRMHKSPGIQWLFDLTEQSL